MVAYVRAVGGVYGLSLLCPGCGLVLFGWFAGWPVSGVWFVVCLRMPMWAWFIWMVCLLAFVGFLYRADTSFPIFIGEGGAVRFSFSLGALASSICNLLGCLWGIALFGNKFLNIQKKKKKISFSSGVSPTLCLVFSVVQVLKTGTTYSSVANSQLVFGRGF